LKHIGVGFSCFAFLFAWGAIMLQARRRNPRGFTAVALVAAVAVFATLGGVAVAAVQQGREAADRAQTMNNLSQCAKAAHLAHDNNKKYPPYFGPYGAKTAVSYHTHLLPFVDQGPLYNQKTTDTQAVVPPYLSPMDPTQSNKGAGAANYPVNLRLYYTQGGLGMLSAGVNLIYPKMPGTFSDGTSNTLMYATKYQNCGKIGGSMWADTNAANSPTAATFGVSMALWQKAPGQAACDSTAGTAVSFTAPTIQVAMCDASVQSVAAKVSAATWQAAQTPGAGDVLGADWNN
jgi:type II secretory pathway pseudopilin PulG